MKNLSKNQKMFIVGALAIALALYFFVIAPWLKRRKEAMQPMAMTPVTAATSKAHNTTARFPLDWLDYNPNTTTLQKQLNEFAKRFKSPKGATVVATKQDGYLGPDTVRLIATWFPGIAGDVTKTQKMSQAQYGIVMSGPAIQPITAKTLTV